ncbi:MAG: hydroxyacid dehydrogenase [Syntrophobacteraceae bacterium]
MKIAVFEVEKWEEDAFRQLSAEHELEFSGDELGMENAGRYRAAEVLSTFIYSRLDSEVLNQFGNLKLIATRSTGFNHIDTDYCNQRGIIVCNVPSYGENTVAEHVFGLLLAISHNLLEAAERTRKGDFSLKGLKGFDLRGKTIGVVGTGHIGRRVVEIAKGFQMDVLAFDLNPDESFASQLSFRYTDMDELFSTSDVITLHVPASEKTRHLISHDEFEKMKDGVILINTARGSVVDIKAMVEAISRGKVRAAGLDVLPEEPAMREEAELVRRAFGEKHNLDTLLAGHILLRLRNVIITPHSAFFTREAIERILDTTVKNIEAFIRSKPENLVAGR